MVEEGSRNGGSVFTAEGVTVRFGGITALEDVSLEVGTGEILGVIGPNGAGKTTLFNVICGFIRPQEGNLRWKDHALDRVRTDRLAELGIARTLQGVGLTVHGGYGGAEMGQVRGGKIVLFGGPLVTEPSAGAPIKPYTTAQAAPPSSGVSVP